MANILRKTVLHDYPELCDALDEPLRRIARRSVRVWFNHDRLDQVLAETTSENLQYDLIYAIDTEGRQVSSNIYANSIDRSAYGQDLSQRPYSVITSVLSNAAYRGVFLCDIYISQLTRRPCATFMYGVNSGKATLGFIAVDFDLEYLPELQGVPWLLPEGAAVRQA